MDMPQNSIVALLKHDLVPTDKIQRMMQLQIFRQLYAPGKYFMLSYEATIRRACVHRGGATLIRTATHTQRRNRARTRGLRRVLQRRPRWLEH